MNEYQLKTIMLVLILIAVIILAAFTIKLALNWNELEVLSSECELFNENISFCNRCFYNPYKVDIPRLVG